MERSVDRHSLSINFSLISLGCSSDQKCFVGLYISSSCELLPKSVRHRIFIKRYVWYLVPMVIFFSLPRNIKLRVQHRIPPFAGCIDFAFTLNCIRLFYKKELTVPQAELLPLSYGNVQVLSTNPIVFYHYRNLLNRHILNIRSNFFEYGC